MIKELGVILMSLFLFSGVVMGQGGEGPSSKNNKVEQVKEVNVSGDPVALSYFGEAVKMLDTAEYEKAIEFAEFTKERLGGTNGHIESLLIKAYAGLDQDEKAEEALALLISIKKKEKVIVNVVEFSEVLDFEVLSEEEARLVIDGEPMPLGLKITLIVIGILFVLFVIVMIASGNGDALFFGLFMAAIMD